MQDINWFYDIGDTIVNDKVNLTIIDRKTKTVTTNGYNHTRKYYKYKCNICGFDCGKHYVKGKEKNEWWIEEYLIANSCKCCSSKCVVKGINDIATTHPHFIELFKDKTIAYTRSFGVSDKTVLICPKCGSEKTTRINKLNMYSDTFCDGCNDGISYPNKFMFNLLTQLNVEFETEYSPEWIMPRRYDFYLPDYNIIIEMDGGFHFRDNNMNGITEKQQRVIDEYKYSTAIKHGIYVFRIDCDYGHKDRFEYVKTNILSSGLSHILFIKDEDFEKANRASVESNIVKASELYNQDKLISEICTLLKVSDTTAREYITKGTKLGLCKYDNVRDKKRQNRKPIALYTVNNEYIGEFESGVYLINNSERLFGVTFKETGISQCANKKIASYKGFVFKFLNE